MNAAEATAVLEGILAAKRADGGVDAVPFGVPIEYDEYWVQGYQSRAFVETGDIMSALAGNGEIVIPKDGRPPFSLSTAEPFDAQMAAIVENGASDAR